MLETHRAKEFLHLLAVYNVGGHELWRIQFLPDNLLPLHWLGWYWLCRYWRCQCRFGRSWWLIVRCGRPCGCSFIDFCYGLKMWHAVPMVMEIKTVIARSRCMCIILTSSQTCIPRRASLLPRYRNLNADCSGGCGIKRSLPVHLLQCLKIPLVGRNPNTIRLGETQKLNILRHLRSSQIVWVESKPTWHQGTKTIKMIKYSSTCWLHINSKWVQEKPACFFHRSLGGSPAGLGQG